MLHYAGCGSVVGDHGQTLHCCVVLLKLRLKQVNISASPIIDSLVSIPHYGNPLKGAAGGSGMGQGVQQSVLRMSYILDSSSSQAWRELQYPKILFAAASAASSLQGSCAVAMCQMRVA